MEAIGLEAEAYRLDTPHNPHNVGWYDIFDLPGAGGNAVLSAHIDYYPDIRGPFHKLANLKPGDEFVVVMQGGKEYRYRVLSNQRHDAKTINMDEVVWPSTRPANTEWATLITCGGRFESYSGSGGPGEYLDRDVVIGQLIS